MVPVDLAVPEARVVLVDPAVLEVPADLAVLEVLVDPAALAVPVVLGDPEVPAAGCPPCRRWVRPTTRWKPTSPAVI